MKKGRDQDAFFQELEKGEGIQKKTCCPLSNSFVKRKFLWGRKKKRIKFAGAIQEAARKEGKLGRKSVFEQRKPRREWRRADRSSFRSRRRTVAHSTPDEKCFLKKRSSSSTGGRADVR